VDQEKEGEHETGSCRSVDAIDDVHCDARDDDTGERGVPSKVMEARAEIRCTGYSKEKTS